MQAIKPLPGIAARTDFLFQEERKHTYIQTDRMFAGLMLFQWLAGIVLSVTVSPLTWHGDQSDLHVHVLAAVFLGGAICGFPVFLALRHAGTPMTRQVMAVAQVLCSALFIHLTGGRIETHFHIFGSLAFLAFYRDYRVLLTATAVVAFDHWFRGTYWTVSVFGVSSASPLRWVEHAVWVLFEDFFLILSIRQNLSGMRHLAERQAKLEATNTNIEQKVTERTAELETTHRRLLEISRQAGMAEVATSVLHNVGNVLNSVNVSATVLAENLKKTRNPGLDKVVSLMREHQADLGEFFARDPRAAKLPDYLAKISIQIGEAQVQATQEVDELRSNIDHIKEIVTMQQDYAKVSGVSEPVQVADLVEDALRMNDFPGKDNDARVIRAFSELPLTFLDKHKVLQILVNLVRNAKMACEEAGNTEKILKIHVSRTETQVQVAVEDNGIGIPRENLTRIFNHGFTTRKNGHGFGLHSGALAAKEMGGTLNVHSDGPGHGAVFTLELPLQAAA